MRIKVVTIATRGIQGPAGISSVINDTNVTGTVVGGALTLGWTGTLADIRIASAAAWNAKQPAGSYLTGLTGDGTAAGPGSAALTLATVNSSPGSFGSASKTLITAVNAKGLITSLSEQSIQIAESQVTSLVSDLAGKQATGNYIIGLSGDITASGPGTVAATLATVNGSPGSFGDASHSLTAAVNAKGLITSLSQQSIQIAESQVTSLVFDLAGKQATGNYITALTGDATASGPNSVAITLATVNASPGSFGDASHSLSATVNAKGLITSLSQQSIQIAESQVTSLVSDLAGKQSLLVNSAGLAAALSDETGSGAAVFGTSPTIAGGSHTGLTSLGIRSSGSGAFDLSLANSENLTAGRTLTLTLNDAARTISLSGNLTVSSAATISGTNTGDQNLFSSIPVSGQTTVTPSSATTALTLVAGSNITITTDNTAKSITIAGSAATSFANPTASIGLAAVNGAASTAMRSDAAPALDQSIAPTWSGNHRFNGYVGISTAPDSTHATGAFIKLSKIGLDLSTDPYTGINVSVAGGNTPAGEHLTAGSFNATASANSTNTGGPLAVSGITTVNAGITTSQAYAAFYQTSISGTTDSVWGNQNQVAVLSGGTVSTIANGTTQDIVAVGTILNATAFLGTIRKLSSGTITGVMKGLDLSGWSGSPATSYGIYMDSSIDRGATKYSIYSLSASPSLLSGDFQHAPTARTSGVLPYFKITIPSDTTLTASTEAPGFQVVSATRQWSTGAITEQRETQFNGPTYGFVGASTVTRAANLYASSPIAGTNATLTKSISAMFEASAAAHVPIYVRGASSQSGNLQEWANSSNTVLAGVTGGGFMFDAGTSRVSTQFDKTNTTLADITGLTAPVISGRTYEFRAVLPCTLDATGLGKFAIAGTATATAITYTGITARGAGSTMLGIGTGTSLGAAISCSTSAQNFAIIEGTITVNAGGTLTVQFAQSAGPNGTSSVLVGGTFTVHDTAS